MARIRAGRNAFCVGVAVLTLMCLTLLAGASVGAIAPSSGQVSPGDSTSASFTVTANLLGLNCLIGVVGTAATPNLPALGMNVTFDGASPLDDCGGTRTVIMTVTAGMNATPGPYVVTIRETKLADGNLIGTYEWPLTVLAPPTTTTTSLATGPLPTITITLPTTTSTSPPTTPVDTSPPPTLPGPGSALPSGPNEVTTTVAPEGAPSTTTTTTHLTIPRSLDEVDDGDEGDDGGIVMGSGPGRGEDGFNVGAVSDDVLGVTQEPFASIAVSEALRQSLDAALPNVVSTLVVSPLLLIEILIRSLFTSAAGLLLPLTLAALLTFGFIRRLRKEVDDADLELPTRASG